MNFKPWSSLTISNQGRIVLFSLLGIVSLFCVIFPNAFIGLIGGLVGLFAIFQSAFYVLDIFVRNQQKIVVPSQTLVRASVFGVIGIILLIIPSEAMRSILGYLIILGLLFFALYQWNLTRKYAIKKQAWAHYVWMILSLTLTLIVAFNLSTITTLLMIVIGGLGILYSLTNLYPLVITK